MNRARTNTYKIATILSLMALTLAIPLSTQSAFSDGNVDQESSFIPMGPVAQVIFNVFLRGQVFVPTADNLIAIDVGLGDNLSLDDTINIRIHPGSNPSNLLNADFERIGTITSIAGSIYHLDLDSPVPLVPGQPYILELVSSGPIINWFFGSSATYPFGNSVFCLLTIPPLCGDAGFDVNFRTYFDPTLNSPPDITAPGDVTAECNETGGATGVDLGTPTVTDPDDNDLPPTNDAVEPFSLGDTTVTWSVEDTDGASDSDTQTVTVVDTTPPDITVPDGFMAIANTDGGWAGGIGQATATDVCSDVDITNDAPDVFPLGDTTVEWCALDDEGNETCDTTQTINVKPLPVEIDIKPGSDPNSINPKSNGVVPVAILGTDSFDVLDVDVTSLAFGPSGATPRHDLTDSDVYDSHLEDVVVIDGFTDLVSHYKQKETGLSSGDTEACITGTTLGGIPFEGCDSVRVK